MGPWYRKPDTASHLETRDVFCGLGWQAAGSKPRGVSHAVCQILKHMSYRQDWIVAWPKRDAPAVPRHASESWQPEAGCRGSMALVQPGDWALVSHAAVALASR